MKKTKFLLLLLFPAWLTAQEKGLVSLGPQNSTRAVVIGISDYQDAAIPDLRFAHRDAEAFEWVESAIRHQATFQYLERDVELAALRALPEWKTLMKKYFPDQVKN